MPHAVTFFYHEEHYEKPIMTIFLDGTVSEHGLPFARRRRCVAQLERRGPGPTRLQLDAVEMISTSAIRLNPYFVLTYKCLTSPWALDHWLELEGGRYAGVFVGPGLPWPKSLRGPLRLRSKSRPIGSKERSERIKLPDSRILKFLGKRRPVGEPRI